MIRTHIGITAILLAGSLGSVAHAAPVEAGDDYINTLPGTWFNFGPGIGIVDFLGDDLFGEVDTIVRRIDPANFPSIGSNPYDDLPTPGTMTTIDIELVALSLMSIDPVFVTGPDSLFDVFISLDNTAASLGSMTLSHEWNDDGLFQGTFDSSLTVFADALFVPIGGGPGSFSVDIDNLLLSSTDTLWNHDWPGGFYFPLVEEEHPGFGVHVGKIVIPAPGGIAALLAGLAVCTSRRRRG